MIADSHFDFPGNLRRHLIFLLSPIQYVVDYPIQGFKFLGSMVLSKKSLIDKNNALNMQEIVLEAELQKYRLLVSENQSLRDLLDLGGSAKLKVLAARIMAVETTASRQLLVVNKGSRDGVFIGQAVLDAKGVMGQVIEIGWMTATVLLITDAKSAVPVRNERTGERSILVGTNRLNELLLINLPKSSMTALGDFLVTSGLGRLYPEGYPVGEVKAIDNRSGDDFIRVTVSPIALLDRARLVLLIWPENESEMTSAPLGERKNLIHERNE